MDTRLSERFFARGSTFLGVQYTFMCGAMTWVSTPELVTAVCNAGWFGCLAGQSVGLVDRIMPIRDIIDELVRNTESELFRVYDTLVR